MREHVFVYGTLKTGHGNNQLLQSSIRLGDAITSSPYDLFSLGIPYMNRAEVSHDIKVLGELWEITEQSVMDNLDILEGVEFGHYFRETIPVRLLGSNAEFNAWAYFSGEDLSIEAEDALANTVTIDMERAFVW